MKYAERLAELERDYQKMAQRIADAQAQLLRMEGAMLLLRELIEAAAQAQATEKGQPAEE